MQRITFDRPWPLFDTAATRAIEAAAAASLPPHTLMQRAGDAVARLARALAPHARCIWMACGSGNNGGDGLEAAMLLHRAGYPVVVTWLGTPETVPPDARLSWQRAREAGVRFVDEPPALGEQDLAVDALLGIGLSSASRAENDPLRAHLWYLYQCLISSAIVLHVDIPSGLLADTGQWADGLDLGGLFPTKGRTRRHTLALLTLKPGLFTGYGRDSADTVWLDDLGVATERGDSATWLSGRPDSLHKHTDSHNSHKGQYGDVAIIGGEGLQARGQGMTGAALLAASAALHAGAGRVFLSLLDDAATTALPQQPEIMLRHLDALDLSRCTVVCGCGGGAAVASVLPRILQEAGKLVLDADALNAIAADTALQQLLLQSNSYPTILTPHPLEAARLLGTNTATVQADRLAAATQLAQQFQCTVLLKGSGSVIASPFSENTYINPTGNALLATAGTGDVLAGLIGALLARALSGYGDALYAAQACYLHGQAADRWPADKPLTALALAQSLSA